MADTLHMHSNLMSTTTAQCHVYRTVRSIALPHTHQTQGRFAVLPYDLTSPLLGITTDGLIDVLPGHQDAFTDRHIPAAHGSSRDGLHQRLIRPRARRHNHNAARFFIQSMHNASSG